MDWKNININENLIKAETDRAVLINCPHNSEYNGFCFWYPSKLVKNGRHSTAVSIGYTDEFTFKLKKYGKGKYNSRDVINEIEINVSEFEEMFGVIDENIVSKKTVNYSETHKPIEKEAIATEVIDELKDE